MAGKADFAKDGVVGDGAAVMIGELRAAGGRNRRSGPFGGTGDKKEAQQGGAEGEQLAEQGQFDGIGGLGGGVWPGHIREQGVEVILDLLYNRF